jgi:hypothetical protein
MVGDSGYIGYIASSTAVSVVADIAESLDISGFTPAIAVSSLTVSEPIAVSGTITTSAPANQNVSGISLDAIQTDIAAIEVLNTSGFGQANTVLGTIDTDTGSISTNIATLTTSGIARSNDNLQTIGSYLNGVEGSLTAIETDGDNMQILNASGFAVLNNHLTTIDVDTNAIKVSVAKLDDIKDAVETLDNAISGNEMQVDVVSMPTVTANISAFPVTTGITGGGVESGAQRVTLANDSTGSVGIKPSTSAYLSHVYIDLDATGDNPATNTEVIAAPGSGNKLVIYGVQGSIVGSAAAAAGNWYLSDGNTSAATTLWTGRAQGLTNTMFELTFPYGVALTTNTALKVTSTEAANHIFINAVVYYRTEAV